MSSPPKIQLREVCYCAAARGCNAVADFSVLAAKYYAKAVLGGETVAGAFGMGYLDHQLFFPSGIVAHTEVQSIMGDKGYVDSSRSAFTVTSGDIARRVMENAWNKKVTSSTPGGSAIALFEQLGRPIHIA